MKLEKVLIVDPINGEFTGNIYINGESIEKVEKIDHKDYDYIVMPGFADYHTHSYKKIDTMSAKKEDFEFWAKDNFSHGVTSFFPTTVSASKEMLLKVLRNFKNVDTENTSIAGLHFEGPFINIEKKGAQNPDYIRIPQIEELKEITDSSLKMITIAPEVENFEDSIKYLKSKNILVELGHSSGNYQDFKHAFDLGVNRITHFPNALNSLHHRDIKGAGAGLYLDFNLEMICDGIHSCPEFVDMVYKIKGADKITLITDSMEATGLQDGKYDLGGLDVFVKNGKATLKDGTIAGSTLVFSKAIKNFKKFTNCSLQDLSKVSSYNAIKELKIQNEGRIIETFKANLVVLDKHLNIEKTIFKGKEVYKRAD